MPRSGGTWDKKTRPISLGRPKGSPNRSTAEMRTWFKDFVDGHLDVIQKILEDMSKENPVQFLNAIWVMLEYVMPRYQKEGEKEINQPQVNVLNVNIDASKLTDEQLLAFFNKKDNANASLSANNAGQSGI